MDKQTLDTGNDLNGKSEAFGLMIARIMSEPIEVGNWNLVQFLEPAEINDIRNYIRNIFMAKKSEVDQDFADL